MLAATFWSVLLQAFLQQRGLPAAFDADEVPTNAGAIAAALFFAEQAHEQPGSPPAPPLVPHDKHRLLNCLSGRERAASTNSAWVTGSSHSDQPHAEYPQGVTVAAVSHEHQPAVAQAAHGKAWRNDASKRIRARSASRVLFAFANEDPEEEHDDQDTSDTAGCQPAAHTGSEHAAADAISVHPQSPSLLTTLPLEGDGSSAAQEAPKAKPHDSPPVPPPRLPLAPSISVASRRRKMPLQVQAASEALLVCPHVQTSDGRRKAPASTSLLWHSQHL